MKKMKKNKTETNSRGRWTDREIQEKKETDEVEGSSVTENGNHIMHGTKMKKNRKTHKQ